MNAELILKKLRSFLLGFSIFIFGGTVFELIFLNHTNRSIQYTPFVLSAAGILMALLMLVKPSSGVLKTFRIVMVIVFIGGIFGTFMHVVNNLAPVLEGSQGFDLGLALKLAFGGRNPFLAPGILSMASAMALTGVYKHPLGTK